MRKTIAVILSTLWIAGAVAQDAYPSKPIRLIVPYGPGGVSDSVGRVLAAGLTKSMNQTVTAENPGGAGGTIGGNMAAQSPPAAYTILSPARR